MIAAREISGQHRSTASEAREAVRSIESAIHSASKTATEATEDLSRTLLYLSWTSLVAGAAGLLLLGVVAGIVLFR